MPGVVDLALVGAGVGLGAVQDGELAVANNVLLDQVLVRPLAHRDFHVALEPADGRLVVVDGARQGQLRVGEGLAPLGQVPGELVLDVGL